MSLSAEAEALTRMGLGRETGRGSNMYMGISGATREQSARRRAFHILSTRMHNWKRHYDLVRDLSHTYKICENDTLIERGHIFVASLQVSRRELLVFGVGNVKYGYLNEYLAALLF